MSFLYLGVLISSIALILFGYGLVLYFKISCLMNINLVTAVSQLLLFNFTLLFLIFEVLQLVYFYISVHLFLTLLYHPYTFELPLYLITIERNVYKKLLDLNLTQTKVCKSNIYHKGK